MMTDVVKGVCVPQWSGLTDQQVVEKSKRIDRVLLRESLGMISYVKE